MLIKEHAIAKEAEMEYDRDSVVDFHGLQSLLLTTKIDCLVFKNMWIKWLYTELNASVEVSCHLLL